MMWSLPPGAYSFSAAGKAVFRPTPAPTDDEVARVAAPVFRRVEGKQVELPFGGFEADPPAGDEFER
jgi:hypothetical protein